MNSRPDAPVPASSDAGGAQPHPLVPPVAGPNNQSPPTVGYAVGSMIGHIWQAIKAPVHPAAVGTGVDTQPSGSGVSSSEAGGAGGAAGVPVVPLHRTVQEQQTVSPDGRLILRRTTIEELEVRQSAGQEAQPFFAAPAPTPPAPTPPMP